MCLFRLDSARLQMEGQRAWGRAQEAAPVLVVVVEGVRTLPPCLAELVSGVSLDHPGVHTREPQDGLQARTPASHPQHPQREVLETVIKPTSTDDPPSARWGAPQTPWGEMLCLGPFPASPSMSLPSAVHLCSSQKAD